MTQVDKFWERVNKDGPIPTHVPNIGQCWVWVRGLNKNGYGQILFNGVSRRAHRLSWELHNGPILDGLHVLHRCDNRKCVRPDHLFLGDESDNAKDRESKGRGGDHRGELASQSKLTTKEVLEIRSNRGRYSKEKIAKVYGVKVSNVFHITNGRSWKHLPLESKDECFMRLKSRMEKCGISEGSRQHSPMIRVWRFDDAPEKHRRRVPVPENAKWIALAPANMELDWIHSAEFGFGNGLKFLIGKRLALYVGYKKNGEHV